jgi:putative addiction module antidote
MLHEVITIIIIYYGYMFQEVDLMAVVMKLRKIGGSVGVIIPKDQLERLHVKEGDVLYGVADSDGLHLQVFDPSFERKLKAFERTRTRYRNALRELGK